MEKKKPCYLDISIECDVMARISEIEEAFPDGIHNHRNAHIAWIESKKAEKEFYDTLRKEVMAKGITGLMALVVIIIGLAITGMLHKYGIPSTL